MDTLDFVATLQHWPDVPGNPCRPFEALLSAPAPFGCTAWKVPLKSAGLICYWVKLRYHDITGELNTTQQGIAKMRAVVDGWLAQAGLTIDDFLLSRIDYDFNFWLPPSMGYRLIETMQNLPHRAMRMDKTDFPLSVYYQCKSRHAQLYRKDKERDEKGFVVQDYEEGMLRQEIQCHSNHIRYQKRRYGVPRTWDGWVNIQRENFYLTHAKPIFPKGDFYTLDRACKIVEAEETLTPLNQKRLIDSLTQIHTQGMAEWKAAHSTNTAKKYLRQLETLNVNPLTIKQNPQKIDFIPNPFYGVWKGGAAV